MNTARKLWVDDMRPIPDDSWEVARTFHEAIYMLERGNYERIGLDHDLGCFYGNREMTGYDVLQWMIMSQYPAKIVTCQSDNPERWKMVEDIARYYPESIPFLT